MVSQLEMKDPGHRELGTRCADAINTMKVGRLADSETAKEFRDFLHSLLELDLAEAQQASVYFALREVGDERSISLLRERTPLKDPWAGVEKKAILAIRRRLKT